jgi:radical SAM superfamily enzyme YgiQ (UPF0313 family)
MKSKQMSKVILINPAFNILKENYNSSISVGLLSIASYLDFKGIPVGIIDGVRQKNYLEIIKEKIKNCQWAGLSVMTTQIPDAFEISRLIRKENPQCRIFWGGSHPTFFPRETANNDLIDIAVCGEGEETVEEIISGVRWEKIRGIVFKKGGVIITNPPRPLHDPARMPLFNWDLMPKEILEKLQLVPSLTSRGCPHRCTFCINAILKNRWRPRTPEQVLEDLKIIKSRQYFKGKKLRFWDENFFVDIKRTKEIIRGMIENDLIIPWETTVRADYFRKGMIDDKFLLKIKESGCYLLSFGAESGSYQMLRKIQKGITSDDIINSAKMCLKYGIIPQYSFMIGLPGEREKDMFLTLKLIDRLVALSDQVQILGPQAFRPYPGSPLYEECVASGWQEPKSLEEWGSLIENELSYLTVANFPWVREKNMVESMEAYVRFGAHSIKSALGSSIKANKILKLGFILLCKLRWKLKFFRWPIEFKIARRYVSA